MSLKKRTHMLILKIKRATQANKYLNKERVLFMSYFAFFKEVGDCNVFEFQTLQERDKWLVDDLTVLTKLPMIDKRVIDEVLHGSARKD